LFCIINSCYSSTFTRKYCFVTSLSCYFSIRRCEKFRESRVIFKTIQPFEGYSLLTYELMHKIWGLPAEKIETNNW